MSLDLTLELVDGISHETVQMVIGNLQVQSELVRFIVSILQLQVKMVG